jgi:transposase
MEITVFAVDLAKNKFQVHGFDARGEKRYGKTLKRSDFLPFFERQERRCEVVMEACGSAHHWGRQLLALGYRVRLIPPQFVKPFVVGNKTDANDADAIYEASRREKVRPVPIKRIEQQDALLCHSTREQWMKGRTAIINQIRGELAERGVVFAKRVGVLRRGVNGMLTEPVRGELTPVFYRWLAQRLEDWKLLDARIKECERAMQAAYEATPACEQIGHADGIGLMTATATVAMVGNGRQFRSGRHFSAWLGVTPKEHSSGERRQLGGLTKRGDIYLRKLYVHGARAVVNASTRRATLGKPLTERDRWIQALVVRRGFNKACVAVANKNARMVWAMLTSGECYRAPGVATAAPIPA